MPVRRKRKGTRPGVTGAGPRGATDRDEVQWVFPRVKLTELEKKRVMAEVMRLAVEVMYNTHIYSFGGKFYKQKEGGPIGLRSTCALARVVMARWDIKWKERMEKNNLEIGGDGRYVDDARVFLYPVRAGWRWEQDGL